jgi:nucleoid-associated protein YgaU
MATKIKENNEGFFSQIKWGESYTSLFLGAVVVIVALVLVVSFMKSRNSHNQGTIAPSSTVNKEQGNTMIPKTYVVKEGDDLWHIAESLYGSGYNWVDLANTNKLQNPGTIYSGTVLTVPDVKPRLLTVAQAQTQTTTPITGVSYTIVKGDYLWSIALRAYGDGYKWVEIAKANNLTNPDIIYAGNTLKLPR